MKSLFRLTVAAVLAAVCLIALPARAQPKPMGSNSLAFPFTIVESGGSSNVLGVTTAVGNLGVWTPGAAWDVPRTLNGVRFSVWWEYAAVTNGVAQTGFFLQGSPDGVHWESDFSRLIAIIQPAKATQTNHNFISTNIPNSVLAGWQKLRVAAVTNGGQPTISNFVGFVTWEK